MIKLLAKESIDNTIGDGLPSWPTTTYVLGYSSQYPALSATVKSLNMMFFWTLMTKVWGEEIRGGTTVQEGA